MEVIEPGQTIAERYVVETELGSGSQGDLFVARDERSGERVALKVLSVGGLLEWKELELFEREIDALQSLDHPGIPSYIDHVELEGHGMVLVQELVVGESLAALLERKETFDDAELEDIARQLLEIAAYIHGRNPPVVHRDIKPANILRRPDGQVVLVDFGGVQTLLPARTGGSTVVGTTGYMPVEQIMGRAVPESDLYAIGATLAHLHSGMHPSDMELREMKLDIEPHVRAPAPMLELMRELLEPDVARRPSSSKDALAILDGVRRAGASWAPSPDFPDPYKEWHAEAPGRGMPEPLRETIIQVTQDVDEVVVRVPSRLWEPNHVVQVLFPITALLGGAYMSSMHLFTRPELVPPYAQMMGFAMLAVALMLGVLTLHVIREAGASHMLRFTPDVLEVSRTRAGQTTTERYARSSGYAIDVTSRHVTHSKHGTVVKTGEHMLVLFEPGTGQSSAHGFKLTRASTIWVAGIARNWAHDDLFDSAGEVYLDFAEEGEMPYPSTSEVAVAQS